MTWDKIKVGNQIVYERWVRFGAIRIWLVAESTHWHIETGSGEVITEGRATSYTDAGRRVTEAFRQLLEDASQGFHALELVHEKASREKPTP